MAPDLRHWLKVTLGNKVESRLTVPSFLVAMPQLLDPNFKQAVILLIDHKPEGAMGLVVNRPSNVSMKSLVRTELHNIPNEIPAWSAGPVGPDRGAVLRYLPNPGPEVDDHIGHGVCLSTTEDALSELVTFARRRLAAGGVNPDEDELDLAPENCWLYPFRFLVGYAGWGAKQLDREIRMGSWMQMPLDLTLLFDTPWPEMWAVAMSQFGVNPMDIAPSAHPYLN